VPQILIQDAIGLWIGKDGKDEGTIETIFDFEKETVNAALDGRRAGRCIAHVIGALGFNQVEELTYRTVSTLGQIDSSPQETSAFEIQIR